MTNIAACINICTNEIPKKYYGRTYTLFSFEVMDGRPIHLFLITQNEDKVEKIIITGLSETPAPVHDFVEFLKSITVDNTDAFYPLSMDLKFAREEYKVDIRVIASEEEE